MPQLKTRLKISDLKTLVVDDMLANRKSLERHLKAMGFSRIDHASSVVDAVPALEANGYDIVFLDWNMPEFSGLHLLQACRMDSKYENIAFVMFSSASENSSVIEAIKSGATAYIVKPIDEGALMIQMDKVMEWLERRR